MLQIIAVFVILAIIGVLGYLLLRMFALFLKVIYLGLAILRLPTPSRRSTKHRRKRRRITAEDEMF